MLQAADAAAKKLRQHTSGDDVLRAAYEAGYRGADRVERYVARQETKRPIASLSSLAARCSPKKPRANEQPPQIVLAYMKVSVRWALHNRCGAQT